MTRALLRMGRPSPVRLALFDALAAAEDMELSAHDLIHRHGVVSSASTARADNARRTLRKAVCGLEKALRRIRTRYRTSLPRLCYLHQSADYGDATLYSLQMLPPNLAARGASAVHLARFCHSAQRLQEIASSAADPSRPGLTLSDLDRAEVEAAEIQDALPYLRRDAERRIGLG